MRKSGKASSPISLIIASSSTSVTLNRGQRIHVNILESDSDLDYTFYNSNSSISYRLKPRAD